MRGPAIYGIATIFGVAIDQWVKHWCRSNMVPQGSVGGKPWPGIFELTLTYNEGIAFGMLQGAGVFMSPIAIVIAILAGIHSIRHAEEPALTHWTMGLFAAGALGNLVDRVVFGKVTDMFWFRAINFPVFNVADAFITVATALLILASFQSEKSDVPEASATEKVN